MSTPGTVFRCETSASYQETIHYLAEFTDPSASKELEGRLLDNIELVKSYFTQRGSLSLGSTRTFIALKREKNPSWLGELEISVFQSNQLQKHAKNFWESSHQKAGWIISQWTERTSELRPHQMPIFVEKKEDKLCCVIFDTRLNWEGIRKELLDAFLPCNAPITFYLSTERRQFDWSTCSMLSLDDLRQLDQIDRNEFYHFLDEIHTSKEEERDSRWTLIVANHLPPSFLRLAQSMDDFKGYCSWARSVDVIDTEALSQIEEHIQNGNPPESSLNNRITCRYLKVVKTLVARILDNLPPLSE